MATLHTVNKSPFERNTLDTCLRFALDGAALLLIEDGVLGAMKGTRLAPRVTEALERIRIYALGPDLEARGLNADEVIDGVRIVDYGGFVDLTVEHARVQSWL